MQFNHIKVIFNNISNTIAMFASMAIALIMTPIYIKYLGLNLFGIWHIAISIISYISLMDLGMQSAIQKYVAQYHGIENKNKIAEIILSSLIFYGTVSIIGFAILILITISGLQYFNIQQEYNSTAKVVIFIMGMSILLTFPGSVFNGVLTGMQLFYVVNAAIIIINTSTAVAIFCALKSGYGLVTMAIIGLIGNIGLQGILFSLAIWKYNVFKDATLKISISELKEMMRFGSKTFMIIIANRIRIGSDALIIGYFMTVDWIPYYTAPVNLIYYARNLIQLFTQAFLPVFSNLEAHADDGTTRKIFIAYSKYTMLFIMPIIIFVIFYSKPFLNIWLGNTFAEIGGQLTLMLSVSLVLSASYPLSIMFLIGTARQNILIYTGYAAAFIFLFIGYIAVKIYGLLGLATAFLVSEIVPCVFILRRTIAILNIHIKEYWNDSIQYTLINGCLMALFIWLLIELYYPNNYLDLAVHCIISLIFYATTSYFIVLRNEERVFVYSKIYLMTDRMCKYILTNKRI